MENKEQKQYYVTVNGQKVPVTEEVYREYVRPVRARQRAEKRNEKCYVRGKRWERVRCTKDCSKCPYASEKGRSAGAPLSLEMFAEQGIELRAPFDAEEALLEAEERKERIKLVRTAVSKLKDRYQYVLREVYLKGRTQESVRRDLGISKGAMSELTKRSLEALRKVLEGK